jgi:PD-(D/E)XK nuclease superfamily protein
MYDTHKYGEIARCEVERRALEKNIIVSRPAIEARYDLILDIEGEFYRAQVKYADQDSRKSQNAIVLDLRKQCRNNGKTKKYSKEEIDVVLVYLPKIDNVLWIGPELFHERSTINLRLALPKKRNAKIIMANDLIW